MGNNLVTVTSTSTTMHEKAKSICPDGYVCPDLITEVPLLEQYCSRPSIKNESACDKLSTMLFYVANVNTHSKNSLFNIVTKNCPKDDFKAGEAVIDSMVDIMGGKQKSGHIIQACIDFKEACVKYNANRQ